MAQLPSVLADLLATPDALRPVALVVNDLANLRVALGTRKERHPFLHTVVEQAANKFLTKASENDWYDVRSCGPQVHVDSDPAINKLKKEQLQELIGWMGQRITWGSKPELASRVKASGIATKPGWVPWGLFRMVQQQMQEHIVKGTALKDYRLDEEDLRDLSVIMVRNPHGRSAQPMRLYRKVQVMRVAARKYGGGSGFEREAQRREGKRQRTEQQRGQRAQHKQDLIDERRQRLTRALEERNLDFPRERGAHNQRAMGYIQSARPGLQVVVDRLDEERFLSSHTPYTQQYQAARSRALAVPGKYDMEAVGQAAREEALGEWVASKNAEGVVSLRDAAAAMEQEGMPRSLRSPAKRAWSQALGDLASASPASARRRGPAGGGSGAGRRRQQRQRQPPLGSSDGENDDDDDDDDQEDGDDEVNVDRENMAAHGLRAVGLASGTEDDGKDGHMEPVSDDEGGKEQQQRERKLWRTGATGGSERRHGTGGSGDGGGCGSLVDLTGNVGLAGTGAGAGAALHERHGADGIATGPSSSSAAGGATLRPLQRQGHTAHSGAAAMRPGLQGAPLSAAGAAALARLERLEAEQHAAAVAADERARSAAQAERHAAAVAAGGAELLAPSAASTAADQQGSGCDVVGGCKPCVEVNSDVVDLTGDD